MPGRRANMRYGAKRDGNEAAIVAALEAQGFCVTRINGKGVPDLLVGKRSVNAMWLVEVKQPGKPFTEAQVAWRSKWTGPAPITLRSVDEACRFMLIACGAGREDVRP